MALKWRSIASALSVFLILLLLACTTGESKMAKMNRDEIHNLMRDVLTAQDADKERIAALAASQAFSAAGHPARVVFKKINQIEDLEPSHFSSGDGAVAVVMVRDEVFLWDPVDDNNVDAFFLE